MNATPAHGSACTGSSAAGASRATSALPGGLAMAAPPPERPGPWESPAAPPPSSALRRSNCWFPACASDAVLPHVVPPTDRLRWWEELEMGCEAGRRWRGDAHGWLRRDGHGMKNARGGGRRERDEAARVPSWALR